MCVDDWIDRFEQNGSEMMSDEIAALERKSRRSKNRKQGHHMATKIKSSY